MKKWAKLLFCGLLISIALAGCATVGNIKNTSSDILYDGGSAVLVNDYLYYGNAFSDTTAYSTAKDYKNDAKFAYLNRINTKNIETDGKDYSPKNTEKVSNEIVAHSNKFVFVLGDYIYYATPNLQQFKSNGTPSYFFNYTTFYRSKLNGDGLKKIYTTNGAVSSLEILKYENKYYIVMLAGGDLIRIEIGKSVKSKTLASDVTSVALPKTFQENNPSSSLDWNGKILYTTSEYDSNEQISRNYVKSISILGEDDEKYALKLGQTVNFVGREKDIVFYTSSGSSTSQTTETYVLDFSKKIGAGAFGNSSDRVYQNSATKFSAVGSSTTTFGYTFINSDNKLGYLTSSKTTGVYKFMLGEEEISYSNVLGVYGTRVLISSSTNIYVADIAKPFHTSASGALEIECEKVVEMTSIYSGAIYAFDGEYVYFYAGLETIEELEEESDTTNYLYRANVNKPNEKEYQLLSLTKNKTRHEEKKEDWKNQSFLFEN